MHKLKLKIAIAAVGLGASLMAVAIPSAHAAPTTAAHSTTATAPLGGLMVVKTHVRPDVTTVKICAHSNTAYCADTAGTSLVSGTKIWLYQNGEYDNWIEYNFTCENGLVSPCTQFELAAKPSLCLTATGTNGANIELKSCSDAGAWYAMSDYQVGNDFYGTGGMIDVQSVAQHSYLLSENPSAGGKYVGWWIPDFN